MTISHGILSVFFSYQMNELTIQLKFNFDFNVKNVTQTLDSFILIFVHVYVCYVCVCVYFLTLRLSDVNHKLSEHCVCLDNVQ